MIEKIYYADIIGASIPTEPWESNVQSIYSKAVNLFHPSGYLISIVDSIENMTDFGLAVGNLKLIISKIFNGSKFQWNESKIIFRDIVIDLSMASEWSGTLCKESFEKIPDIAPLKSAYTHLATEEGLSPVITNTAGNIYSNVAEKILKMAVVNANKYNVALLNLSPLVGLGIGFTPSGDDFLAGVMLYEAMSGTNIIDRETIKAKLSGTTEGGRTLLQLSLRNSFPFYLKEFAESITNVCFTSEEIVKQAVKHGSTSGSDSLAGFLWAKERELEP
ncbi:MAG: DUF2877 domain-containing protein [Spirochaetia bacterium]|jgi:hypothetical protein|nr:DUF2877 domain-containing protein [Spirochaetia bacterium]